MFKLFKASCPVLLLFAFTATWSQVKPVALHPDNPHYFIYNNKPTVFVGSGEHYGAVINLDFDYITYFKELSSEKLNITRTFTGSYVESSKAFNISNNTLAPAAGRFICPWKRSNVPGYAGGGNKFDLSSWDEEYFRRLKDFVATARKSGVVVELAMFCPFYEDTLWQLSPMNSRNNINNIEKMSGNDVYTLDKNKSLMKVQEDMVRKIVTELNAFDNVLFEICNEPYFGGVTLEWQHRIADVIVATEKDLPNKHLITQNIANGSAVINNPHPGVSVFNFHYAWPPVAVAMNYHLNKPIGDNETGFRGNSDSTYRMEGWRFILAGGSLYNHLDYSFAPGYEKGNYKYGSTQPGGGSDSLRKQLSYLRTFIEGFDFIKMKPDSTVINNKKLNGAEAHVLAENGKQYAVYFYGTSDQPFEMNVASGSYEASWMNTTSGKFFNRKRVTAKDNRLTLTPPKYQHDVALKLIRK